MPHRKNAKGDIGSLQRFSDTYDMDNVYLSEEGWVYRHFKNSERTLWWDEILVAGQVKPGMKVHGVSNNPVVPTNPLKLGTAGDPTDGGINHDPHNLAFEVGDGYVDFRYSDHDRAPDKVTAYDTGETVSGGPDDGTPINAPLYKRTDFEETAWESINVEPEPTYNDLSSQVPSGWTTSTDPSQTPELAVEGEAYQSINHYTVENPDYVPLQELYTTPMTTPAVQPGKFPEDSGPMEAGEDYIADPDGPADAFGEAATDAPDEDNKEDDAAGPTNPETPTQQPDLDNLDG